MMAWADGGFTPKRASTVASVSPRRNLTPTRGGSSAATGGGGLGSWSFCGEFTNGAHNTTTIVARARTGNTNYRRAQIRDKRAKIFSLLHHDEEKLFQPFYRNIFPGSKKKC